MTIQQKFALVVIGVLDTYRENLLHPAKFSYADKAIAAVKAGKVTITSEKVTGWPKPVGEDEKRWAESIQHTITKKVLWATRPKAAPSEAKAARRNPAQQRRAAIKQTKAEKAAPARSAAMTKQQNAMVRAACAEAGITVSSKEGKHLRRTMRNAALAAV